jgi:hypothetical protein
MANPAPRRIQEAAIKRILGISRCVHHAMSALEENHVRMIAAFLARGRDIATTNNPAPMRTKPNNVAGAILRLLTFQAALVGTSVAL